MNRLIEKSLTFMLCCALIGTSSCSYIDEKDQPLEVEDQSDRATFSVTECNLNNDVNNVNSFLTSFLRSEFKYDCSDTYNFDNVKVIKGSDKPKNVVFSS